MATKSNCQNPEIVIHLRDRYGHHILNVKESDVDTTIRRLEERIKTHLKWCPDPRCVQGDIFLIEQLKNKKINF